MFCMTMKGGGGLKPAASASACAPPSLSCRTLGTEWRLKKIIIRGKVRVSLVLLPPQPPQQQEFYCPPTAPPPTVRVQCDSLQHCGEFAILWRVCDRTKNMKFIKSTWNFVWGHKIRMYLCLRAWKLQIHKIRVNFCLRTWKWRNWPPFYFSKLQIYKIRMEFCFRTWKWTKLTWVLLFKTSKSQNSHVFLFTCLKMKKLTSVLFLKTSNL